MSDENPNQNRKDQQPDDERSEEFRTFEDFLKKLAQVPKEEVDEKRREWEQRQREKKRAG